jgi:uncharacterized Zn finger protein
MFIKTKENFICENCGEEVVGNGFTNHCPNCLYSKHLDIDPGDRKEKCEGIMKPVEVLKKGREYNILQKCIKCGFERLNKTQKEDNFDVLIQIQAEKQFK